MTDTGKNTSDKTRSSGMVNRLLQISILINAALFLMVFVIPAASQFLA